MSALDVLSPGARAWGKTFAVLGVALAVYLAVAFGVTALSGDAIIGTAVSDCAAFVFAIAYRWKSTGTPLAPAPRARARSASFWVTAAAGLVACWLAGQTAASWAYSTWGSASFDAVSKTQTDSPVLLLLGTALVFAPVGEESLMRGIAYPALRKHWPPLASAFVTAAVFALLHGNLVQIMLTIPLGVLLAFVYEASQRLWPGIVMHVAFNFAATFLPAKLITGIAHPAMIGVLLAAVVLLLFALTPGRYAARGHEGAATTSN